MLVLGRREQQRIVFPIIGVEIVVCKVNGSVVRLGIKAPDWLTVVREEMLKTGKFVPKPDDAAKMAQFLYEQLRRSGIDVLPVPPNSRMPVTLVVEDNPNERELLTGLLNLCGFEVIAASEGKEAVDYLRQKVPDLVLLDMSLPDLPGHEVVKNIKELADKTKVFAVVGQTEQVEIKEVDGWFQKPLNPNLLIKQLKKALMGG